MTTERPVNSNEASKHKMLVSYLENEAEMYRTHNVWGGLPKESPDWVADIYDWFLDNAVPLQGMDLELADKEIDSGFHIPEIKQCYYNSMMADPSLEYWEGWAVSPLGLPLNHAWNIKDEQVVDTTWGLLNHMRKGAKEISYLGINIPRTFIMEQLTHDTDFRSASCAGPFLWDYALKCLMEER